MWKSTLSAALRRAGQSTARVQLKAPLQGIQRNFTSTSPAAGQKELSKNALRAYTAVGVLASIAAYHVISAGEVQAEVPPSVSPQGLEQTSSQHLQVIDSWKRPGVYAWGFNKGRVVDMNSDESYIRAPRRIPFFDNLLLRDLKLESDSGVAVDENGDILQWGVAYSKDLTKPELTLAKKNIVSVETSATRIFALSKDGTVYSFPKSKAEQQKITKLAEKKNPNFYKTLTFPLGYFEKVSSISSGLDHLLVLTSTGRVFSCAASTQFPNRGQLGIEGLTWTTRPKDALWDAPHLISFEGNPKITQIATGDFHSLALDSDGKVWVFGDNSHGQLGFDFIPELETRDIPTELSIQGLYPGTGITAKCTKLAAGGLNSYFLVDAIQQKTGKVIADIWSSGRGLWGGLGNGKWTHIQGQPTKLKSLSGLVEFDEKANTTVPIRVDYFSVGRTHTAAVMRNHTETSTPAEKGQLFGQDALLWGNNEYFQLGTGRRSNLNVPSYIAPLETSEEREKVIAQPRNGDLQQQAVPQHRLQVTPRKLTVLGDGRKVEVEQRVLAGHGISAVYSKV